MLCAISSRENATIPRHPRSWRRLRRNEGWFDLVESYSDQGFKKLFGFHRPPSTKHKTWPTLTVTLSLKTQFPQRWDLELCLYRLGQRLELFLQMLLRMRIPKKSRPSGNSVCRVAQQSLPCHGRVELNSKVCAKRRALAEFISTFFNYLSSTRQKCDV